MAAMNQAESAAAPAGVVAVYAAMSVLAAAVYLSVPSFAQNMIFMSAAWAAFLWAAAALYRAPSSHSAPLAFLAGALLLGNLAGLVRRLPQAYAELSGILPLVDAVGNLLFLMAALTVVFRRGRNDLGGLLETMIFVVSAGALLCVTLVVPRARGGAGPIFTAVTIVLLCGVLVALMRLWHTAHTHRRQLVSLIAAVTLGLAGQFLLATTGARFVPVIQLLFIGAYTAVGLFAASPAANQVAGPGPPPEDHLTPARLVWLGLAVAAMPAAAILPTVMGHKASTILIAVCGCLIAALVMLRIGMLATLRRQAEAQLQHLADHDPLTGALNRRAFETLLASAVTAGPCVLAYCDIDRFKEFNDQHGHAAGDELLLQITKRMRESLRPSDILGRIGGDEFVVLASAAPEAAPLIERRLLAAFAKPVRVAGVDVTVAMSIGTAASDGVSSSAELLRLADKHMYENKGAHKSI
ncbi:GGDEF domain-containing protein [Catelliglobosispora koreensis]|uniref:GGDEF domain-containing protein n=1 Tax=Catelliglobosispora koreensis TaxID=129052 RepID=UPI000373E022|nr:GGDEF domain-containing protein [Catelliglobosispora koreensis]